MDITNKKIVFDFDKNKFNFAELFLIHLSKYGVTNLQEMHLELPNKFLNDKVVSVADDQSFPVYEVLYDIFLQEDINAINSNNFWSVYKEFIFYLSSEIFNEELVYQKKPTLRVQFPNNKAVGGFHRDRDYNHPPEEINIWIPVTSATKTNSIWIESQFDLEDYSPVNMQNGQGLIFDSGLKHGNKLNEEGFTRVSFDFRVIPKSIWSRIKHQNSKPSLKQNLEFKVNGYYDIMS